MRQHHPRPPIALRPEQRHPIGSASDAGGPPGSPPGRRNTSPTDKQARRPSQQKVSNPPTRVGTTRPTGGPGRTQRHASTPASPCYPHSGRRGRGFESRHAEYFVPWLTRAFADAKTSSLPQLRTLATDNRLAQAIHRLERWNFTTPTGIPRGYDATDRNGMLSGPSRAEIANSVAATLYAVWRSQAVVGIIDAPLGALPKPDGSEAVTALRHLLDDFASAHGVGASGVDFFAVPGINDPAAARDYLLLHSLSTGLTLLAGPAFGAAFHGSTQLSDYRWALLHRIVLQHPLGGPFSVPTAFGQFPQPLPGLSGIPVDGGFETVDAASHDVRAASSDSFGFDSGPARRFIAKPGRGPGGTRAGGCPARR